jgi:hypothetical protein
MKVLMENFSENLRDQIPDSDQLEQYHYKQEEQEKEEEELRRVAIQKQKGLNLFFQTIKSILKFLSASQNNTEVLKTLKLRAKINNLALTLYLGESDLVSYFIS